MTEAAFLLAALDAFRRLADATDASLAERTHWIGLTKRAHRLFEAQQAQDGAVFAALNESGRVIGAQHHRARLSDADVELIHELAASGMSHARIAAKFDDDGAPVSRSSVGHILAGRRRSQTVTGHRLVVRYREPIFWPADVDEFEIVMR